MADYLATIKWRRGDARFTDNRYSRLHEWEFDGGITVPGSASPHSVRPPFSSAEAVDPEEAFVAAISSCHMLWFLSIAAKQAYVVDSYVDHAVGRMEKNGAGKMVISKVTLRPAVAFSGEKVPDDAALDVLHHQAHEECYIANSVRSEIVVERA